MVIGAHNSYAGRAVRHDFAVLLLRRRRASHVACHATAVDSTAHVNAVVELEPIPRQGACVIFVFVLRMRVHGDDASGISTHLSTRCRATKRTKSRAFLSLTQVLLKSPWRWVNSTPCTSAIAPSLHAPLRLDRPGSSHLAAWRRYWDGRQSFPSRRRAIARACCVDGPTATTRRWCANIFFHSPPCDA